MRQTGEPTESLAGSLLLSHPAMKDPNFNRSVVLLSAHDDEGALGVVLNRPLGRTMADLTPEFAASELHDVELFQGGPVQTDRLLICGISLHAGGGGLRLHFGLDPDKAEALRREHGDDVEMRGFMGHAGWSAGQLENELKHHTWAVSAIPPDLLLRPADESLWRRVISNLGPEWRLLAHEPEDPGRN